MASLRHPNICNLYGVCFFGDFVWIIMQLVPGGQTLERLLHSAADIPLALQRKFILQSIRAVNYLHNRKDPILHRDIKSPNFLLQEPETLLLTDFGTSNFKRNTSFTGRFTFNWAAPEVLQLKPNWTEKADIYSLGMVFFEIIARKTPFVEIRTDIEVQQAVNAGKRPNIPMSCPTV